MKKRIMFCLFVLFISTTPSAALDQWQYKLSSETPQLINTPFLLLVAADLNNNGTKELIVTNFGKYGNHIDEWKQWQQGLPYVSTLMVLEWVKDELKTVWKKQWDTSRMKTDIEAHRYFLAFEARQMVAWEIGNRTMVETIPPYLGLEWNKDKYVLREQQGPFNSGPLVGSWVFPWLSPSCYESFPNKMTWPRECLIGIRDFSGNGDPKIVSIIEDEIIKDKRYNQKLRVRKYSPGFPIEWEQEALTKRFVLTDPIDKFNFHSKKGILFRVFRTAQWYYFEPKNVGNTYQLQDIKNEGPRDIELYDLPDYYLRSSKKKGLEEYWGYHFAKASDNGQIPLLRKVALNSDLTGFVKEDINFDYHKSFIGIGFFDVEDIDGDGIDEVILVEETGKRKFEDEDITYSEVKDYIRILKWDRKQYKTMWVSPPYTKRGTKFLIEDIKNTGKKQLVVMTPYGTIQIWERK